MKIEEQVLSIEQMKHLQELGVDTSDASMAYYNISRDNQPDKWVLGIANKEVASIMFSNGIREMKPAYTTGDLFRKLPSSLKCDYLNSCIAIHTDGCDDPLISASYEFEYNDIKGKQVGDTIEEALYNLLCWVAINRKELLGIK